MHIVNNDNGFDQSLCKRHVQTGFESVRAYEPQLSATADGKILLQEDIQWLCVGHW